MFVAMFDDVLARCRGKKGAGRRFVESAKQPDSSVAERLAGGDQLARLLLGRRRRTVVGWKKPVVWYRTLHSALASSPFPFPPRAIYLDVPAGWDFFFLEDPGSRWMAALS
jgi:hypothetical protein